MARGFAELAFSDAVRRMQERFGARDRNAELERDDIARNRITPQLAALIAQRNSFFLATASASGQPYIQHRGGEPGFLHPLDEHRLAFADVEGNRQYISYGNLSENPKALIFLMDWANRQRIKIWGEARLVEDDEALLAHLPPVKSRKPVRRAIVFDVAAWDVNCPQHIPQLFTLADVEAASRGMLARIAELEAEVERLRGEKKEG